MTSLCVSTLGDVFSDTSVTYVLLIGKRSNDGNQAELVLGPWSRLVPLWCVTYSVTFCNDSIIIHYTSVAERIWCCSTLHRCCYYYSLLTHSLTLSHRPLSLTTLYIHSHVLQFPILFQPRHLFPWLRLLRTRDWSRSDHPR